MRPLNNPENGETKGKGQLMAEEKKALLTDYLTSIVQVGLVVEDLDVTLAGMRRIFKLEPDSMFEAGFAESYYRGEFIDTPARIANYDFFGTQIEFIQPLGDQSIWRDYLNEGPHHGHSLHHIRFTDVEDNDVITNIMADLGIEKYQEQNSFVHPGGKGTYYDTKDELGFFVEVVTKAKDA
jgi:hypothetical protein